MVDDANDKKELSEIRKAVLEGLQREHDATLKTSSSQLRAVRNYRKRHKDPDNEGYHRIRRQALTFVKPKKGTRAEEYIKKKGSQYYKDLLELNKVLKSRINELHLNIREDNNHEEDK